MADFLQTLVLALALGSVYALIALGYTMVYGILKFINFAHSDIFVLGAWLAFTIAVFLLGNGVPWWLSFTTTYHVCGLGIGAAAAPGWLNLATSVALWWLGVIILMLAMMLCGSVGFLIERFAYKPLRKAPRLNVLITAIGVSLLLQNVGQLPSHQIAKNLNLPFGKSPQSMPDLLSKDPEKQNLAKFEFAPPRADAPPGLVVITKIDAIIFVSALLLMIVLEILVFHTKIGMGMRAVSFSIDNAALMGVPVDRIISFTFVLGSMLAAAAGFLYALAYRGLNQPAHETWVLLGLKAFVAAVVGGIGNVRGAVLGGFLIAAIENFGMRYIDTNLRDVYVFAVLILVLLVKPGGLLGTPAREKV